MFNVSCLLVALAGVASANKIAPKITLKILPKGTPTRLFTEPPLLSRFSCRDLRPMKGDIAWESTQLRSCVSVFGGDLFLEAAAKCRTCSIFLFIETASELSTLFRNGDVGRANIFPLIAKDQVGALVRLETAAVIVILAVASWVFYKIFLKAVSEERHKLFRYYFRNLTGHVSWGLVLFGLYQFIEWLSDLTEWQASVLPYVGLLVIIWGCIVFVKSLRIMASEYLFLSSMHAGVPLLLVNIFTLVLSLVVLGWLLTTLFGVNLTHLLATSAVLSIVLGLALQDTLGNLFAGIALQFDKPFELGDWIEVKNGSEKIAGQVQEISWRATLLLAITDELITIPNRTLAQWQIANFSARQRPFIRSQVFRLRHDCSIPLAKETLYAAMGEIPGILVDPSPVVIITETTESWITLKAVYYLNDYGGQYGIADKFTQTALRALSDAGISLATPRLTVDQRSSTGRVNFAPRRSSRL